MKPLSKKEINTGFSELKKHNAAIHIDTKNLTITHRKAFNLLLWQAWDNLEKQETHYIGTSELCHTLGYNNIQQLYVELKKMPFIPIEWNILRDDGWPVSSGSCGLIAGFEIIGNKFEYSFYKGFRKHLKNPQLWTKVKIEIANLFTKAYALALYETCLRYADIKSTGWIEMDAWRGLLGIPDTKLYESPSRINARIIQPAVAQVNSLADIEIKPAFHRQGRGGKITHMQIDIEKKKNYKLPPRQLKLFKEKEQIPRELVAENISRYAPPDSQPVKWLEQRKEQYRLQKNILRPLTIKFTQKPSSEVRDKLRKLKFRFDSETLSWIGMGKPNEIYQIVHSQGVEINYGQNADLKTTEARSEK